MSDGLLDSLSPAALAELASMAAVVRDPGLRSWLQDATGAEQRRRAGEDVPAPEIPSITDRAERIAFASDVLALRQAYRTGLGEVEALVPMPRFPESERAMAGELVSVLQDLGQGVLLAGGAVPMEVH